LRDANTGAGQGFIPNRNRDGGSTPPSCRDIQSGLLAGAGSGESSSFAFVFHIINIDALLNSDKAFQYAC